MILINRLSQRASRSALWSGAFRPFFILASLASVFSLAVWLLYLNKGEVLSHQQLLPPLLWHVHEMFFAFTLTIAVGFLLTAVQAWTGLKSLQGLALIFLSIIWIAIRFLLLLNQSDFPGLLGLVLALQTIWWLIVLFTIFRLIIKSKSKRNYILLPLMFVLMLLQLSFLYWGNQEALGLVIHLARSAILVFAIVVAIIAGRVIPLFTRNALQVSEKIKAVPLLDRAILLFSLVGCSNFFFSYFYDLPINPGWALLLVGILHLVRLSQWASIYTLHNPLLWSLHVAYFCLASGLILIAASFYSEQVRIADAFHLVTVGVFGGMILSMISRVSLGHTGRPLRVNNWISLSFVLIFIAVLLRVVLAILGQPLWAWNSSALLWISAYLIFLKFYTPILFKF